MNQIQPTFQPTKSAAASDVAMIRQPSRWSKSFCRKKARFPQKPHCSTPALPIAAARFAS